MQIVRLKDKVFQVIEAGPWQGKVEIESKEIAKVLHRWGGHRIPLSMFVMAQSFCEWSYAETKSEAMVHFFYHQDNGWKFVVLPQRGHTGMSVKLIEDHPNRIPTYQNHLGEGWEPMGTLHHHCGSSAFQSMTDQEDEKTKEGLHITLGHIGQKEYSIDLRASFRHVITDVVLTDWFEVPEEVAAILPSKFHKEFLETVLMTPPKEQVFPEWWKENLIKVVYQAPAVVTGPAQGYTGYAGNGNGGTYYSGHHCTHWDKQKFERAIKKLCHDWADCNLQTIYATLQEITWAEDLINEMVDCDHHVTDAMEWVEDAIDKERQRMADPVAIDSNKAEEGADYIKTQDDMDREMYGWQ